MEGSGIIYHAYSVKTSLPLPRQISGEDSLVAKRLLSASKYMLLAGIAVLAIAYFPSITYYAKSTVSAFSVSSLLSNTLDSVEENTVNLPVKAEYQPRLDPSLPFETRLVIPSIGVDTEVTEATFSSYEDALKKGVWRVSDFGSPADRGRPTILAAHRYGYLAWTNTFRRESSFFNLPKLKVGDTVEVVYKKRKYFYEVYGEGRGEEITDYEADLILYTCEDLTSPIRVFKYAKLLEV